MPGDATRARRTRHPGTKAPAGRWDAFISHSSRDDSLAARLEKRLQATGVSVWIDHTNLRRRGLLLSALQDAMSHCANVVLLWSKPAAESRYVAAEWNFAWNRELPIFPCMVDDTQLPLGLAGAFYCDLRSDFNAGVSQLAEEIGRAAPVRPAATVRASQPSPSPDRAQTVMAIYRGQDELLAALDQGQVEGAAALQSKLDPVVDAAMRAFPHDADVLSLAGYHKKNAYQIKHWNEIQARRSPRDPLLPEAEQRFWDALKIRPDDPGALNGLGSILWLRGDLDAAEFCVKRALERAKEENLSYPYAEEDLANIRREMRARKKR